MSTQDSGPGLPRQAQLRTFFRVAGPLLAVVGAATSIYGFVSFLRFDPADTDSAPLREMALFMGGFVVLAIGAGMARAGFGAVAARYAAGALSPVLRDTLRESGLGQGTRAEGTGPYCRECGSRATTPGSTFCSACGTPLA